MKNHDIRNRFWLTTGKICREKAKGLSVWQPEAGVEMVDATSGVVDPERCGVETADGTPCKNPADSCRWHGGDAESAESSKEDSYAIPTEEWWRDGAGVLGSILGTEEAWDNHSLHETVAKQAIRRMSDSQGEKEEMFHATFGTCPECGERGVNGFQADTCNKCQPEATDGDAGEEDGEVSLGDLSDEAKEKLVGEVLDSL
jgi:hypothetical protein